MNHLLGSFEDYLKKNTDYAFMIDGNWGAGKTFYLNTKISELLNKMGYSLVYISLNGLRTTEEVNKHIFFSTSKLFNGDSFKKIEESKYGKLIKSFSKLSLDLGMTYAGLNQTKILFEEFISINPKVLLCFDDLERSQINIDELMGLVNSFLEKDSSKILILTNETELISNVNRQEINIVISNVDEAKNNEIQDVVKKKSINRYIQIKEKTIGRTISFVPSSDYVLEVILNEFINEGIFHKFLLEKNNKLLLLLDSMSQRNLRVIIQAINDYKKVFDEIHKESLTSESSKDMLCDKLFDSTFIFSIELRLGNISANDLFSLSSFRIELIFSKDEVIKMILRKYYFNINNKFSLIFYNLKTVIDYIISGNLDTIEFKNELIKVIEYTDEAALLKSSMADPLYIISNQYLQLEDDDFKELLEKALVQIEHGFYELKQYFEAFNLFEQLIEKKIILYSPEYLLDIFKKGIDKIEIDEKYMVDRKIHLRSYNSVNDDKISSHLQKLLEYSNLKILNTTNKFDSDFIKNLLTTIEVDFNGTINSLFIESNNPKYILLFFNKIGLIKFTEILIRRTNKDIRFFSSCIDNSYSIPNEFHKQHFELLTNLYIEIDKILDTTNDLPIKKLCLEDCLNGIKNKTTDANDK